MWFPWLVCCYCSWIRNNKTILWHLLHYDNFNYYILAPVYLKGISKALPLPTLSLMKEKNKLSSVLACTNHLVNVLQSIIDACRFFIEEIQN